MTFVAAVITAVRLTVRLFRFCNSVAAVRELPKVQPVLCVRQKRTRRNMDLVVSITLGILVYIVFSHRVVWSFQRQNVCSLVHAALATWEVEARSGARRTRRGRARGRRLQYARDHSARWRALVWCR